MIRRPPRSTLFPYTTLFRSINAEDVNKNFAPCPGTISNIFIPGGLGIRVDTCLYDGYKISPFYDSMIAKLIVHGENREEAINRMRRALAEFIISGVKTNIDYRSEERRVGKECRSRWS